MDDQLHERVYQPVEIIRLQPIALKWQQAAQYLGMTVELPTDKRAIASLAERFRRWRIRHRVKAVDGLYPVKRLQKAIDEDPPRRRRKPL